MIIARAPLRLSFAGGGTDLPAYADRHGGLVVSVTLDRYVYVHLTAAHPEVLQITAADANSVLSRHENQFDSALFWGNDYRLPLEILNHFSVTGGYRIFIASEVPPGTGLGSSSSTAVALIRGLAEVTGRDLSPAGIAELACQIEIERMGMPIGRQDQYAAAMGGLNTFEFSLGETWVTPLDIPDDTLAEIQSRTLLFFTGKRRRSTDILLAQRQATSEVGSQTLQALHDIKRIAYDMRAALIAGDLESVGHLLDESWQQKRRLAPGVSTQEIDEWYAAAKEAGAIGGKIAGAGGGGFLMLYADPARRWDIVHQMSELGLVWVDAGFERDGATVFSVAPAPISVR